jgi:hypothetical protein
MLKKYAASDSRAHITCPVLQRALEQLLSNFLSRNIPVNNTGMCIPHGFVISVLLKTSQQNITLNELYGKRYVYNRNLHHPSEVTYKLRFTMFWTN